jgi:hypothetical protein
MESMDEGERKNIEQQQYINKQKARVKKVKGDSEQIIKDDAEDGGGTRERLRVHVLDLDLSP